MKNTRFLLLFLLLSPTLFLNAQTYTMNWGASIAPAWANGHTSGTASNVGGSGISVSISITKTGGVFAHSNGSTGITTPTVSGSSFTVGGSSANLELALDYTNHGEHTDILFNFSTAVRHCSFDIADIDKPSATGIEYMDEIVVSGSDGVTTYLPTLTKYDATTDPNFLVISGNTANANPTSGHGGNSASTSPDQKGTVKVDFGATAVTSVSIRYKNVSAAQSDPDMQGIAIGNISFQKLVSLPVSFVYIKAQALTHENLVQWQTASEQNNDHFEIEKSGQGLSWVKTGTVAGAGTSSAPHDYSFSDHAVQPGSSHYRIKQVDRDGKSSYSAIVAVTRTHQPMTAEVYPNPVQASSVVSLYTDKEEEMRLTLVNAHGQVLFADIWPLAKGANELSLPLPGRLAKGHYFLRLHGASSGYSKTIRLVTH